jgi:enterochelin esterase-like enzyme
VLVGIETVAAVLLATVVSGAMDQTNATLVVMGFDPDRAQLITSLIVGIVAGAAIVLATGRLRLGAGLGAFGAGALFSSTFVIETQGALAANGVNGAFDAGGWLLTLAALGVSVVVAGWAGAALAFVGRPFIARAVTVGANLATRRPVERRALRYPLGLGLIVVLLAVTVPAFGDLVNYAPDSLMRRGAAPVDIAAATAGSPDPTVVAVASTAPSIDQTVGPSASAAPSPTRDPSDRPWLAWKPSGPGTVTSTTLTAPWKGGIANAVDVAVYLPPGYGAGKRRYPVLYEAPTGYRLWDGATNVRTALDTLIDQGSMPATIVVFIDSIGGPYPDTECANSYDHREWFDTFVGVTMVGWVDSHYRTIAASGARAISGMSAGGYCAANLALHHAGVFGTSISFSGYFQAGASGSGAAAPFGGNKDLLAANSPTVVAGQLGQAARRDLYFILVAQAEQALYGPQASEFEGILATYGYSFDDISASEPHGWQQVRDYFPRAMEAWASHEVVSGVF